MIFKKAHKSQWIRDIIADVAKENNILEAHLDKVYDYIFFNVSRRIASGTAEKIKIQNLGTYTPSHSKATRLIRDSIRKYQYKLFSRDALKKKLEVYFIHRANGRAYIMHTKKRMELVHSRFKNEWERVNNRAFKGANRIPEDTAERESEA